MLPRDAEISPRPADERQVHGFDLFIPAHGLDGMLPHCPGFRSDNGGRLLSGHNALPAFVFDTGLRFPAPVPVRVRTLEGGRRALPELFALRDGGQGYPERIDLPDDRMVGPSVGEADHDLSAGFRKAEQPLFLPGPALHWQGNSGIDWKSRIRFAIRGQNLNVHGKTRAEPLRCGPLPRSVRHGDNPRIAIEVQSGPQFRKQRNHGPLDGLFHAASRVLRVI